MVTKARALTERKSAKKVQPSTEKMLTTKLFSPHKSQGFTLQHKSRSEESSINPMDLVTLVRIGVPGITIKSVAEQLDIPLQELYGLLHVTPRTAQRLINTEKLDADISDRIVQLMKIHDRCLEVFKDKEKMVRWLKTPNFGLGDQTPLSLLDTTDGIELIANTLTRIEYGVFA